MSTVIKRVLRSKLRAPRVNQCLGSFSLTSRQSFHQSRIQIFSTRGYNEKGIRSLNLQRFLPPKSLARQMSTSSVPTQPDPRIAEVIDFWFSLGRDGWFRGSSKYDTTIKERFGDLVETARTTSSLDESWTSTPSGSLALIILLDQFTRNIYRPGSHPQPGLSWSGDDKALQIASQAIAQGFDYAVQEEYASHDMLGRGHRYFFYMPFMHAESLVAQVASVSLYRVMAQEMIAIKAQKDANGEAETEAEKDLRTFLVDEAVDFAKIHMNCVAKLGRFPKRNEPLGRKETEEERKFLEEHPLGF